MRIIFQHRIYRSDLQANPTVLYLFGDNEQRSGLGGLAKEVRGEPNAHGIRTKKAPTKNEKDYWSDDNIEQNRKMIDEDFAPLIPFLKSGMIIVIPSDGIGTGLAELPQRAPLTMQYLNYKLQKLRKYAGTS